VYLKNFKINEKIRRQKEKTAKRMKSGIKRHEKKEIM
jgi:hypothetical protein